MSASTSKRISDRIKALRRRCDHLDGKTGGGKIPGYQREEFTALVWVLSVLDRKCSCERDDEDPCFHCVTHGVVAARRKLGVMGQRQSEAVRHLREVGPEGLADEVFRILYLHASEGADEPR